MDVCFCVHRLPFPPIAGGRTETFRLIAGLVESGHDVRVVSYGDDQELADEMARTVGCTIDLVAGQPDRTVGNLVGNLLTRDPLPVTKSRSDRYLRAVRQQLEESDILHLHAIQTSFVAERFETDVPTVIRLNNVKYPIYQQYARQGTRNPLEAAYAYLQYRKSRRYERAIPDAADLTLTITGADRDLVSVDDRSDIRVLPAGVDLEEHRPMGDTEEGVVTFFGSMDYHPNGEGVRWFVRKVLPRLRERRSDVSFEIVGKNPPSSVRRLGREDGIKVTGFVDDIDRYIDRATVVAIPIRVGTGVRMKVLHAMAMGKAVVSTPLGVQGIRAEDGVHVAIAERAEDFMEKTDALLGDRDERQRLGTNARRLMAEDHDWSTIVDQLDDFYQAQVARTEVSV